jgi:hypothetical protein
MNPNPKMEILGLEHEGVWSQKFHKRWNQQMERKVRNILNMLVTAVFVFNQQPLKRCFFSS